MPHTKRHTSPKPNDTKLYSRDKSRDVVRLEFSTTALVDVVGRDRRPGTPGTYHVTQAKISCTHGRNGIRLQVLQTSFRATLCGGLIPPRILPLPLAGSVPSAAETWAVPWDGTLKPDAASSAYTRSTCPSRSFGYAARCTPGCGDQLGGPAFARVLT